MDYAAPDPGKLAPLRYFNLFRLVVAGLFLVAGRELSLGADAPGVFLGISIAYLGAVLLFGFPDAQRWLGMDRLISLQVVIDILVLAAIMWSSGGYASGMPVMMMVYLAAAGLVAEGRMGLFFAALATVAVLVENAWRYFGGGNAAEFHQVGLACIGFFAIAFTARLLARRAKTNESLAALRGEALDRQQAINERIIKDMRDGVIVLGSDGRIRQANPRASQLLGVALTSGMMLPEVDAQFYACAQDCAVAEGCLQRMGPSGKLLRCRAVNAGVSSIAGSGKNGDILIFLTDFEEIQQQIQQVKLAALGRLTASMAHEIRNPLSAVSQAADLLCEEKRTEVQERLVRIINDNARRIERMVRDVLALGRREDILLEALNLRDFVNDVIEEFSLCGAEERAVFALDIDPAVSIAIDRAHLHQILGNLLTNARRHCTGRPGSVRILASASGDGRTVLHVFDDGEGVSDSGRAQVFEPFFTTDPKGTGLGLYIARELAEANNARLEFVGNEPGAHFALTGRSSP